MRVNFYISALGRRPGRGKGSMAAARNTARIVAGSRSTKTESMVLQPDLLILRGVEKKAKVQMHDDSWSREYLPREVHRILISFDHTVDT